MSIRSSSPPPVPPELDERVSLAFERLTASAAELNAASDELAKPIRSIDASLQKLNLGVTAWVSVAGSVDQDREYFWDRSIGYQKVAGSWGVAICAESGSLGDEPVAEVWRFNDAPRLYRLESIEKLPELIEKLADAATDTTAKLRSKLALTRQVATTIKQVASSIPARRK